VTASGAQSRKAAALVLSGLFPGLGQFYNRQPVKGLLFLVVGSVFSWIVARAVPANPVALVQPGAIPLGPLLALSVVWLWSLVDAWRMAGR